MSTPKARVNFSIFGCRFYKKSIHKPTYMRFSVCKSFHTNQSGNITRTQGLKIIVIWKPSNRKRVPQCEKKVTIGLEVPVSLTFSTVTIWNLVANLEARLNSCCRGSR